MKDIWNEDVDIVARAMPKKKGVVTSKKPWKKNVKDMEENEEFGSKNWKDSNMETIIALHGEMEQKNCEERKETR